MGMTSLRRPHDRWSHWKCNARNPKNRHSIAVAIREEGEDNFDFKIIEERRRFIATHNLRRLPPPERF